MISEISFCLILKTSPSFVLQSDILILAALSLLLCKIEEAEESKVKVLWK